MWLQGPEETAQGLHPEIQDSGTMPWGVTPLTESGSEGDWGPCLTSHPVLHFQNIF